MVSLVFLSLLLRLLAGRAKSCLSLSVLPAERLMPPHGSWDWRVGSWNLLNLMALPLVLGTGVDYKHFYATRALRRHHGDLQMAYRAVGRAPPALRAATAIAGFGFAGLVEQCRQWRAWVQVLRRGKSPAIC